MQRIAILLCQEAVIGHLKCGMLVKEHILIHSKKFIYSYGHKNNVNAVDTIGTEDYITSGFDR